MSTAKFTKPEPKTNLKPLASFKPAKKAEPKSTQESKSTDGDDSCNDCRVETASKEDKTKEKKKPFFTLGIRRDLFKGTLDF